MLRGSFLLSLGFQRRLHTSVCVQRQFVKDVYKVIDYELPGSPADKETILDTLNTADMKELSRVSSKKMAKVILDYREEYGQFDRVERLLDIDKVEKRNIEQLSKKILKREVVNEEISMLQDYPDKNLHKRLFSKDIIPRPNISKFKAMEDKTFVGVHLNTQGVAFAKKLENHQLESWSFIDMPTVVIEQGTVRAADGSLQPKFKKIDPSAGSYYDMNNLFKACQQILDSLPEADFYIFEEPLPLLPRDPYLKFKLPLVKLRTTLMTLMLMRDDAIYSIKPNVLDSLFKLKRGSERISALEIKDDIFEKFRIDIDPDQMEQFHMLPNQGREYLMLSLLKTVAFHLLCQEAQGGFKG